MRFIVLVLAGMLIGCGGWDSEKSLNALDDQELEALCVHFYELNGGAPREEACTGDSGDYTAVLGTKEAEVATCKAKERPACATRLLEECVTSLNGSLCADNSTPACVTYVNCELGQ